MNTVSITIPFDEEKLKALDFTLQKNSTTTQQQLEKALAELYEKTVPEALREYVDSHSAPTVKEKPKRQVKSTAPKLQSALVNSLHPVPLDAVPGGEVK